MPAMIHVRTEASILPVSNKMLLLKDNRDAIMVMKMWYLIVKVHYDRVIVVNETKDCNI